MMEPVRACPICSKCGSKRFERLLDTDYITVRCKKCGKITKIS